MKRKTIMILTALSLSAALFAGCGNSSGSSNAAAGTNTSAAEEQEEVVEKEYITEDQIDAMMSDPDSYKGKYVQLSGVVFTEPEFSENQTALQMFHDPVNSEQMFLVYADSKLDVKTEDFVIVDGLIEGTFTGENYFGSTITAPRIHAETVTPSSYIDVVAPTIKEVTPEGLTVEQNEVSLTIDKIEYAKEQTRVYLTVVNNSEAAFDLYTYSMVITQDGSQYESDWGFDTIYNANLPEIPDSVLSGITASGVVVFPAIDSESAWQLHADGWSDDYELEFEDFVLDVEP